MDVSAILIGFAIGVVVAAPIGPVNIMTIQRSMRYGFLAGLATGIGGVGGDVLFASIAAHGVTAVTQFIEGHSLTIQLVGALLLLLFGVRIMRVHPHIEPSADSGPPGALGGMVQAFAMTVTNPAAVFGFLFIFGSLGDWGIAPGNYWTAWSLVAGVAAGSMAWWTTIAGIVAMVRHHLKDRTLEIINRVAGAALLIFGIVVLIRLVVVVFFPDFSL